MSPQSEGLALWYLRAALVAGAVMALIAPLDWPYGYYTMLRWVVCGSAVFLTVVAVQNQKPWWTIPAVGVAILHNPIAPVHLDRETWMYLDFGTAVMLGAAVLNTRFPRPWAVVHRGEVGENSALAEPREVRDFEFEEQKLEEYGLSRKARKRWANHEDWGAWAWVPGGAAAFAMAIVLNLLFDLSNPSGFPGLIAFAASITVWIGVSVLAYRLMTRRSAMNFTKDFGLTLVEAEKIYEKHRSALDQYQAANRTKEVDVPRIDINSATVDELAGLWVIGPILAKTIVDQREAHGLFTSMEDFRTTLGLSVEAIERELW